MDNEGMSHLHMPEDERRTDDRTSLQEVEQNQLDSEERASAYRQWKKREKENREKEKDAGKRDQVINFDDAKMVKDYLNSPYAKTKMSSRYEDIFNNYTNNLQYMYEYWKAMIKGEEPYKEPVSLIPSGLKEIMDKYSIITVNKFWDLVGKKKITEKIEKQDLCRLLISEQDRTSSELELRARYRNSKLEYEDKIKLQKDLNVSQEEIENASRKAREDVLAKIPKEELEKDQNDTDFLTMIQNHVKNPVENAEDHSEETEENPEDVSYEEMAAKLGLNSEKKEEGNEKSISQQDVELLDGKIPGFTTLFDKYLSQVLESGNVADFLKMEEDRKTHHSNRTNRVMMIREDNSPDGGVIPDDSQQLNYGDYKNQLLQDVYKESENSKKEIERVVAEVSAGALELFRASICQSKRMTSYIYQFVQKLMNSEVFHGSSSDAYHFLIDHLLHRFLGGQKNMNHGDQNLLEEEGTRKEYLKNILYQYVSSGLLAISKSQKILPLFQTEDKIQDGASVFQIVQEGQVVNFGEKKNAELQIAYYNMRKDILQKINENVNSDEKLQLKDKHNQTIALDADHLPKGVQKRQSGSGIEQISS